MCHSFHCADYVLFVPRETMIDHLEIISTTVHKESQEAKSQNMASGITSTSKVFNLILDQNISYLVSAIAAIAKKAIGLSNKSKKEKKGWYISKTRVFYIYHCRNCR